MTSESKITKSLNRMFLSSQNIRDVSAYIGRDATSDMKKWSLTHDLDDYESVQMDWSEALDFVNIEFAKGRKNAPYELNMARGQKYPKHYIDEGVERYSVEDWRAHDAQSTQEVMRSNENFRYGNKFKRWEIGLYKRHYDRDYHETGLRDIRELNNPERGYDMSKIYGPNEYESCDSAMYDFSI